jgi:8-oxo-dGTP diphosphatase
MRKAICVVVIENGCILLVQKHETWILPGGKPEDGESDIQCLIREVSEELPSLRLQNPKYIGAFTGITPHKNDELCAEVYIANSDGEITTAAEINAAKWVNEPEEYNLSDITRKIVLSLHQNGYL